MSIVVPCGSNTITGLEVVVLQQAPEIGGGNSILAAFVDNGHDTFYQPVWSAGLPGSIVPVTCDQIDGLSLSPGGGQLYTPHPGSLSATELSPRPRSLGPT